MIIFNKGNKKAEILYSQEEKNEIKGIDEIENQIKHLILISSKEDVKLNLQLKILKDNFNEIVIR